MLISEFFSWNIDDDTSEVLQEKSKESYRYLSDNFSDLLFNSGEIFVDNVHGKMFDTWFPIQKSVANSMGHAILSTRGKDYFITPEQAKEMQLEMQPGDIMLQRRNWHLSNVGIPGFWTHSAMYTGDIDKLDEYFASESPVNGYSSFSEYIKNSFPEVYKKYQEKDKEGYRYSVIEAIEPGVVLRSLEKSTHADFVAVLRPGKLNKKETLSAILKSYEHFGKPYDYNFDFDTRDALVCSELIYDSYFEHPPLNNGLHFETSLINGRKIVSPLNIAQKFKEEKEIDIANGTENSELNFVYFIAGNESKGKAEISDEQTFIESVTWPKFSFFQSE